MLKQVVHSVAVYMYNYFIKLIWFIIYTYMRTKANDSKIYCMHILLTRLPNIKMPTSQSQQYSVSILFIKNKVFNVEHFSC